MAPPAPRPAALILVTSDPAASARPAEGLRLAAGLFPWGKFDVHVFLDDEVVRRWCLEPETIRDEPVFRDALAQLGEEGGPGIRASATAAARFPTLPVDARDLPLRATEWADLGRLCAAGGWTLRF